MNTPLTELGFGFSFSSDRYGVVAVIPLWFCTFFSLMGATVPWLSWIKWRFSLRTLLLAMTLIAVVLGLAMVMK